MERSFGPPAGKRNRRLHLAASLAVIAMLALLVVPAQAAPGTEGSVVDYSQCANDKPGSGTPTDCTPQGWIFGILNPNNSQYAEDQGTAQRLILDLPKNGPQNDRTITLKYLVRKGVHHAYDSLASWDLTIAHGLTPAAQKAIACQSLNTPTTTACNTIFDAGASVLGIPDDTSSVTPNTGVNAPSGLVTPHMIPTGTDRQFRMYGLNGGQIQNAQYGTLVDESGDLYQSITITYDVNGINPQGTLTASQKVMLLFSGHLAASGGARSWGSGNGASDINGGPYHIKLTNVDGASIGNRDNQIMAGAILPLQTGVATELHQTTDATGTTDVGTPGLTINATLPAGGGTVFVKDVATVTPSDATGTVSFRYYNTLDLCNADTTGTGGVDAGTNKSVSSGTATSDVKSFTSAGTVYWRAFFDGTGISTDSSSLCNEVLNIRQNSSTVTELHETDENGADITPDSNNGTSITVSVGANVTDYATVTPTTATGSVAFRYYSGNNALTDCATDRAGFLNNGTAPSLGTAAGGEAVSGGSAKSTTTAFNDAGTFYWVAFFTGTGLNNNSVSACDGEVLTVQKGAPTLATSPTLRPQDSATLSGILAGGSPQATITFELFGPGNATCDPAGDAPVYNSGPINVTGNGTVTTDNTTFVIDSSSPTGTYRWLVSYSGDSKNEGNSKACGVEQFTVTNVTAASAS
jgi:hypothetical protein